MKKLRVVIIINAIIWVLVIVGCSLVLKRAYIAIQSILAGGAMASLFLLAGFAKKSKDKLET